MTALSVLAPRAPILAAAPRSALARCAWDGTLELLYQPEIDLETGGIVAMEALLRWHHADLGLLTPAQFLAEAERTGDAIPIGDWVLATGSAELASWRGLACGSRQLWLNVTAAQLQSPHFAASVAATVAGHGLAPGLLGLELSEATLHTLGLDARPMLAELRAAGVALAVDDLTGLPETLGAIGLLPVSAVKLGQRHVRGIDAAGIEPVAATLIRAAHDRGLHVVASGVETWAEADRLLELGCDRAHGWLYASAIRADKARWLLSASSAWQSTTRPIEAARPFPVPLAG